MSEVANQITVGPQDAGRRMSFEDFQRAQPENGHVYELARGVVEVTDIPNRPHARVAQEISLALSVYVAAHRERVRYMASGSGAKIELPEQESERHPDISLYLTEWPESDYPWDKWVPDIVIEVVSSGKKAHRRDHITKRQEYLAAGVREYWIVDLHDQAIVQLDRHGDRWKEQRLAAGATLRTPRLPGFALDVATIFVDR